MNATEIFQIHKAVAQSSDGNVSSPDSPVFQYTRDQVLAALNMDYPWEKCLAIYDDAMALAMEEEWTPDVQ